MTHEESGVFGVGQSEDLFRSTVTFWTLRVNLIVNRRMDFPATWNSTIRSTLLTRVNTITIQFFIATANAIRYQFFSSDLSGSIASMVEVLLHCLIMRMATNESISIGQSVCTVAIQLSIATTEAFRYHFFERPRRFTCLDG